MKRVAILALAIIAATATAHAKPIIAGDLILNNLDTAFERAAASVGETVAIYGGECEAGTNVSCSYEVAGPVKVVASGPAEDAPAESISLVYTKTGDAGRLGVYLSLLVVALEPDMTMAQRKTIVTALAKGAVDGMGTASGKNADYSAIDLKGDGIWFTGSAKTLD